MVGSLSLTLSMEALSFMGEMCNNLKDLENIIWIKPIFIQSFIAREWRRHVFLRVFICSIIATELNESEKAKKMKMMIENCL